MNEKKALKLLVVLVALLVGLLWVASWVGGNVAT
jgi:hypothetical protein